MYVFSTSFGANSDTNYYSVNIDPPITAATYLLTTVNVPNTFDNIIDEPSFSYINTTGALISGSVPNGKYDIATLIAQVISALNATDPGRTYTANITLQGRVQISVDLGFFSILSSPQSVFYILGWTMGDTASATTHIAPSVFNILRTTAIIVESNIAPKITSFLSKYPNMAKFANDGLTQTSYRQSRLHDNQQLQGGRNILAIVPAQFLDTSLVQAHILTYQPLPSVVPIATSLITNITFALYDDRGRPIILAPNAYWSVSIVFNLI